MAFQLPKIKICTRSGQISQIDKLRKTLFMEVDLIQESKIPEIFK